MFQLIFRKVIYFSVVFLEAKLLCLYTCFLINLIMSVYPCPNFITFHLVSTIQFKIVVLSNGCLQSFLLLVFILSFYFCLFLSFFSIFFLSFSVSFFFRSVFFDLSIFFFYIFPLFVFSILLFRFFYLSFSILFRSFFL